MSFYDDFRAALLELQDEFRTCLKTYISGKKFSNR